MEAVVGGGDAEGRCWLRELIDQETVPEKYLRYKVAGERTRYGCEIFLLRPWMFMHRA